MVWWVSKWCESHGVVLIVTWIQPNKISVFWSLSTAITWWKNMCWMIVAYLSSRVPENAKFQWSHQHQYDTFCCFLLFIPHLHLWIISFFIWHKQITEYKLDSDPLDLQRQRDSHTVSHPHPGPISYWSAWLSWNPQKKNTNTLTGRTCRLQTERPRLTRSNSANLCIMPLLAVCFCTSVRR